MKSSKFHLIETPTRRGVFFKQTTVSMDTLKHHESFISKQCLKSDSCSNYIDKQTEFVETCRSVHPNPSAIYTIIQDKLFRIKYQSVENYFRYPRPNSSLRWDVSRAQAYRFMDCHPVLNILASCTAVPHRIRLCQALKKSVGSLDPTRMHSTWSTVVKECEGVEEAIAGFDWSSLTPSQPAVLASDEDSEATVGTGRRKRHGGGGKKR